ncbi:Eukaryotic translation initiation factor 5A [Mortierella alpina]|uniref:Eukaryotic translation initiation factor 5A n=1 Tax=Mortierella alpina TaxID=64518 RepID=A0A9P6J6F6_MORAP|nr:Eukaryotic translation initiation factor 5A [Mortierella alpina]
MTTDHGNPSGLLEAPKPCSELQKKDHVLLKGRPCEVKDISIIETNDCQILVKVVAEDVLTGEAMEDSLPYTTTVDVPVVERRKYRLLDITDGVMQLEAAFAEDVWIQLKVPEGPLGQRLIGYYGANCNVFINTIATMGKEDMASWTLTPKLPEHLARERPQGPPVNLLDLKET